MVQMKKMTYAKLGTAPRICGNTDFDDVSQCIFEVHLIYLYLSNFQHVCLNGSDEAKYNIDRE